MRILERKLSVVIRPRRDENTLSIYTIREKIPGDAHSLSRINIIIRKVKLRPIVSKPTIRQTIAGES